MSPKEKATELVDKFKPFALGQEDEMDHDKEWKWHDNAKECASICAKELYDIVYKSTDKNNDPYGNLQSLEYWTEVHAEITNL